ncbi:MAG: exosortase system-associated protein, TIGR04073 family [Nitrososphaera sp.]|nr:exosortase system-associated protein, TIGR04073 family [Nitrososphaera sp.]
MKGHKRGAVITVSFALILSAHSAVFAQDGSEEASQVSGMLRKLGRGIANVATCPFELLRTPEQIGLREGYLAALTVGLLEGAWRTILRGTAGLFEVATFYVEVPEGFKPLIKPEFAFGHDTWSNL